MTLQEFTNITIEVVREHGIAEYLPTVAVTDSDAIIAIRGIPDDIDHREAIQSVVLEHGYEKREFLFGVRSAPDRIITGHFRPGRPTLFMQIAPTTDGYSSTAVRTCEWWNIA